MWNFLSPTELIDPRSVLSGAKPILKATKNWFLPLDEMQPEIEKFIDSRKKDWKTNVFDQCKSWLNQGLQLKFADARWCSNEFCLI